MGWDVFSDSEPAGIKQSPAFVTVDTMMMMMMHAYILKAPGRNGTLLVALLPSPPHSRDQTRSSLSDPNDKGALRFRIAPRKSARGRGKVATGHPPAPSHFLAD